MCRIAGVINKHLPVQELQHKVASMCDSLKHGGPDDEGIYTNTEQGLCFGHRRLSIIDLSAKGHQPMADLKQQVWITFNGEIYNYLELKAELSALGAGFASDTDTEIIIQAYQYWGEESFSKLRGMFAFALHDVRQQLTYLVRDSNGIKPMYYHVQSGQLSFASEVKAFKTAGLALQTDQTWKINFLTYGHIPEPYTTLKGVYSLPKSSFLRWEHATGNHTIKPYSLDSDTTIITNADTAKELVYQTFQQAIQRQLIADAPIGVFLSGGIDSSLIALLANQKEKHNIKYTSIYFNENAYNERHYQQLVTQQLTGQQDAHLVTYSDFESCLPDILQSMDLPTTDGINTWFISKYARQGGLKAVLSGLGADEQFGGYPSFKRIKYINYLKHLPITLLSKLAALSKPGYRRIAFLKEHTNKAEYLFLRGIFTPDEVASLLGITAKEVEQVLYTSGDDINLPAEITGPSKAGWLETNLYMQNQLLRDTDVMSMSHGLEVRVPFLDEDFTQLVNRIHPDIKFSMPPVKKLLLDSFPNLLPDAIWNRPKMGFTFPLQQWMKDYKALSNESNYSSAAFKKVIKEFNSGKLHWSKAFAVYQLQQHV